MSTLDIVIAVLALGLALLIAAIIVIPEGLRWLAPRNRQKFRQLKNELSTLEQSLLFAATRLRPFRDLKADEYRQAYGAVRGLLLPARDDVRSIKTMLAQPVLADIPSGGWAISFLLSHPRHAVTIPSDAIKLQQIQRLANRSEAAIVAAAREQGKLDELPQQLIRECQSLRQGRLAELTKALNAESKAGIQSLRELRLRRDELLRRSKTLETALFSSNSAGLDTVDDLAGDLRKLTEDVGRLEADVSELHHTRVILDNELRSVEAGLEGLLREENWEQAPQEMRLLTTTVESQLKEVEKLRAETAFGPASELILHCQALVDLNNELYLTMLEVRSLERIRAQTPLTEEIRAVNAEWQQLLSRVQVLVQEEEIPIVVESEELPHQRTRRIVFTVQALRDRVAQLKAEHAEILATQEKATDREFERLEGAWESLQDTILLSRDDVLARSYHELLVQREQARGNPLELEILESTASLLAIDLRHANDTLQNSLHSVREKVSDLKSLAAEAEREAGNWQCLKARALFIRGQADSIEDILNSVTASGLLAETHRRIVQCVEMDESARSAYLELGNEAEQLVRLEDAVDRSLASVRNQPGTLDPAAIDRVASLVEEYRQDARTVEEFERAQFYLDEARGVARSLATR